MENFKGSKEKIIMKARWLKRGSYTRKHFAHMVGAKALRENSKRTGYKIKQRGNYWDVFVYTTEKTIDKWWN